MKLYVNLNASNLSAALVRSSTTAIPVRMPDLVLADITTLEIVLTTGTAIDPSTGASGYSIKVGVGIPGQAAVALQTTFTPSAGINWTGQISLNTVPFSDLLDGAKSVEAVFEIELTDPSGNRRTIAQAPVTLRNEVVAEDSLTPEAPTVYYTAEESRALFVQNRSNLDGITGGGITKLDGIATVDLPAGIMVAVRPSTLGTHKTYLYQLFAGAAAESSPGIVLPDDYNATTNAKHWKLQTLIVDSLTANNGITTNVVDAAQVFASNNPPLDDDEVTRKDYVDAGDAANAAAIAAKVAKAGDTMTGALTLNADPTSALHAATKQYVDAMAAASASGLDFKASVRAATTATIFLSGEQTIDGVACVVADRVLVKDQSSPQDNGIYICASSGWVRASDANSDAEVTPGLFVMVEEGTANGDTAFVLTTNATITLGTTPLTFVRFNPALTDGEVTDSKIGNRTIDDTQTSTGDTGTLTSLLSWIGNVIKGITGKSSWRTAPRTTLENAVKLNGDTMTGALSVQAALSAYQLMLPSSTLTYAATTDIDFTGRAVQKVTLAGNIAFTFSNLAADRAVTVEITADSSARNITYPSGVRDFGLPTSVAANKMVIVSFRSDGTTAASVRGAGKSEV